MTLYDREAYLRLFMSSILVTMLSSCIVSEIWLLVENRNVLLPSSAACMPVVERCCRQVAPLSTILSECWQASDRLPQFDSTSVLFYV